MKLIYLKITDPKGFRSLRTGFDYRFRNECTDTDENTFKPFVCVGKNGSGKSNLLEVLAAIFYHLECMYLDFKPDGFEYDADTNLKGFRGSVSSPDAYTLIYITQIIEKDQYPSAVSGLAVTGLSRTGRIKNFDSSKSYRIEITKKTGEGPVVKKFDILKGDEIPLSGREEIRKCLPDFVLAYSSGENEILSLPFFKIRFLQYDEYLQALQQQHGYSGIPESRLVYLDRSFSQVILLCNLLFQETEVLRPFREEINIENILEFRIIIRQSIYINYDQVYTFGSQDENQRESIESIINNHPALSFTEDKVNSRQCVLNLVKLLDGEDFSSNIIPRLKRCATCWYVDEADNTLYLDYYINQATKNAFKNNFNDSPLECFQAFQVLLSLNLFSVSQSLKTDVYRSDSQYVSETIPVLASDERITRFKEFWISKKNVSVPILMKSLSDGEHQLLHSLGLCLLYRNTNSLFLLDEPETHFNPEWRADFISRLQQVFHGSIAQEMLITTHTPFLVSDSTPEKVLIFSKDGDGQVSISNPDFNTFGASINKITMTAFGKRETIGGYAQSLMEEFKERFKKGEDKNHLIDEINMRMGDSVEKVLLLKDIFDCIKGED